MSNVSINNLPVIEARLQVPRFGAWTSDVVVDAETASQIPTGSAVALDLADGELTFSGTVYRGDAYAQTVTLRIIGGKNGLNEKCEPRFYNSPQLQLPLKDLLSDAGETLSSTSDQTTLQTQLAMWSMLKQEVSLALSSLAEAGPDGAVWRVLQDGTVFFGVDSYATSELEDYELIDYAPNQGLQIIAAEVPNVFPGQTFNNRPVSVVEHIIKPLKSRATVWFEDV